MSLAIVSASGPTMTWTMLPARSTPWAPAAFRAASSTMRAIGHLGAEPGGAWFDLDYVVGAAQASDDALRLASHQVPPGVAGRGLTTVDSIWSSPV